MRRYTFLFRIYANVISKCVACIRIEIKVTSQICIWKKLHKRRIIVRSLGGETNWANRGKIVRFSVRLPVYLKFGMAIVIFYLLCCELMVIFVLACETHKYLLYLLLLQYLCAIYSGLLFVYEIKNMLRMCIKYILLIQPVFKYLITNLN